MSGILVIEDEKKIRDNVKEILELNGQQVIVAKDGIEGLSMAYQFNPELIICDIMMPVMDGYQVLEELRKSMLDHVPFIFLSAKSERIDERRGMESGADDYITKPFTSKDLLNGVSAQMEKQRMRRKNEEERILQQRISLVDHFNGLYMRNALNTVIGMTSALEHSFEGHINEEQQNMFRHISSAGYSILRYIRNFHCYETINQFKEQLPKVYGLRPFAARSFIQRRALLMAREFSRENNLILNVSDIVFPFSEYTLTYVIDELLYNAFRFTNKEHFIYINLLDTGSNFVLQVIDSGKGFTAFNSTIAPFQTFESSTEMPSAGLGLSNIKYITEVNGGIFSLVTAPDEGCSVTITFTKHT